MEVQPSEVAKAALQMFGRAEFKGSELNAAVAVSQLLQGIAEGTLIVEQARVQETEDEAA
jgi:hypothetical protein